MTEMDIQQSLIQLKRLVMLKRGEANCIDQQEIDRMEQNMQHLCAHFVQDFHNIAKKERIKDEEFEDVYQQTFKRIVQYIPTYHPELGGSGWIATVFRNCLADFLKRQCNEGRFNDTDALSSDTADDMADPASTVIKKERIIALNLTWEDTPQAEKEELRKRGRGLGRKAWHQAVKRFRERFWQHYDPDGSDTE